MSDYHIFHSVNRWLPPTAGWINDQIELFNNEQQTVLADHWIDNPFKDRKVVQESPSFLSRWFGKDFRSSEIRKHARKTKILFSHFGNRAWADRELEVDVRIARFYGYDLHRLPYEDSVWHQRYQELFTLSDLVLTEGPYMKNELVGMGCPEEKLRVLPLGVHLPESFTPRIKAEVPQVLIAGAFKEKKGILDGLKAFEQLHSSGFQLKLHLVGDTINATETDKKYGEQVQKFMHNSPAKEAIEWHGFVKRDALMKIATKCQCALLPSKWAADRDCEGGFPVAFLDLMSTGLPIVSTYHCDIPFAVNTTNGILVNEGDCDAMASALVELLTQKDLTAASTAAYKTVKEQFNWALLKPQYHETIVEQW